MTGRRRSPAQKMVRHDDGIPPEFYAALGKRGVNIKPNSPVKIISMLSAERIDNGELIAKAVFLWDTETIGADELVAWMRDAADDIERDWDKTKEAIDG